MKRVRVGFLGPSTLFGGAERWMLDLIRFCDRDRIEWTICVIAYASCDSFMRDALGALIPTYQAGCLHHRGKSRTYAIDTALEDLFTKSDIVIGWELDAMMRAWTEKTQIRVVNVAHRQDPSLEGSVCANHRLAAVWGHCRTSFGRSREAGVRVIPNGIDLARCKSLRPPRDIRTVWAFGNTDLLVGYIGRIAPEKNCQAVARAVNGLGKHGRGIIYGSRGSRASQILAQMESIGRDHVRIHEPVDDVGSILHAIDVFLLPSYTEGVSLSLLEAWAAGVPTVTTPVGAVPDLQRRFGQLTVTVEPDASAEALAKAVLEAVSGPARQDVQRRARDVVVRYFTATRMASEWTDYLTSIAGT